MGVRQFVSSLLAPAGRSEPRTKRDRATISAGYDAAGYDPDFEKHWQFATGLSADANAPAEVRRRIRNRARYEVLENNSYGKGIITTLADDTVGTGPRLQLHIGSKQASDAAETEFGYWASAIGLADKLRTIKKAKTVDGEAVAKLTNNPPIAYPVKLDLQLVECDRLASPLWDYDSPTYVDGITLDEYGNPIAYDILREHPGGTSPGMLLEYDRLTRNQVIHFFTCDRPEQHRGISEVVSALPLFAMLRRFTLATVTAAETAANHAVVIQTDDPMDPNCPADHSAAGWEHYPLSRNDATVLPNGYKLGQVSPEHPATTYQMFKREILNEVARCLCVPYNIAAADSSGYNYASGRLDHQVYDRAIKVEQSRIAKHVLDRLLSEWLLEASLVGILPAEIATVVFEAASAAGTPDGVAARIPHSWQWDRRQHVDPSKEAGAQRVRLQSGTTSRELEMREMGLDIDEIDDQAARSFGLSLEQYRQTIAASLYANGNMNVSSDDQETNDDEAEPQPQGAENE